MSKIIYTVSFVFPSTKSWGSSSSLHFLLSEIKTPYGSFLQEVPKQSHGETNPPPFLGFLLEAKYSGGFDQTET